MHYLAIDIGASSGRHIVGWQENGALQTREVYRFPNGVTEADGHLTWDIAALESHVRAGIDAALREFPDIVSLSVDTWGVDYVLMDGDSPGTRAPGGELRRQGAQNERPRARAHGRYGR